MQLATRYSKLPDEVIYAEESGWNHDVRFAFNDAVTAYVEEFERMQSATKEKTVPKPRARTRHTKRVPVHSEAELLQFLGIDPEAVQAKRVLEKAISAEAWENFLNDGEWDTDPETVSEK